MLFRLVLTVSEILNFVLRATSRNSRIFSKVAKGEIAEIVMIGTALE